MPGFSMSVLSTQAVLVPVRAWKSGAPYNPTGDGVQMAFPTGASEPATWYTAQWAWTTAVNGFYAASCVVGPAGGPSGTISLAQGSYTVWVKITDNPEIPVLNTGTLTITP